MEGGTGKRAASPWSGEQQSRRQNTKEKRRQKPGRYPIPPLNSRSKKGVKSRKTVGENTDIRGMKEKQGPKVSKRPRGIVLKLLAGESNERTLVRPSLRQKNGDNGKTYIRDPILHRLRKHKGRKPQNLSKQQQKGTSFCLPWASERKPYPCEKTVLGKTGGLTGFRWIKVRPGFFAFMRCSR